MTNFETGRAPVSPPGPPFLGAAMKAEGFSSDPPPTAGRPWQDAGPPPGRRRGMPTWAIVLIVTGAALVVLCCGATAVTAVFGGGDNEPRRPPATVAASSTPEPTEEPSSTPEPTEEPEPEPEPEPELDLGGTVTVRATGAGLILTNNGQTHWTDCNVDLNRGLVRSGYTFESFELYPAGTEALDQVTVAWGLITDRNGSRFDYATTAPEQVTLQCQAEDRFKVASYNW